jgi:hypothetical protein
VTVAGHHACARSVIPLLIEHLIFTSKHLACLCRTTLKHGITRAKAVARNTNSVNGFLLRGYATKAGDAKTMDGFSWAFERGRRVFCKRVGQRGSSNYISQRSASARRVP